MFEAAEADWDGPANTMANFKLAALRAWDTGSFRCAVSSSFEVRMAAQLTVQLALLVVFVAMSVYVIVSVRRGTASPAVLTVRNVAMAVVIVCLLLLYSVVVETSAEAFYCVDVAAYVRGGSRASDGGRLAIRGGDAMAAAASAPDVLASNGTLSHRSARDNRQLSPLSRRASSALPGCCQWRSPYVMMELA